MSGRAGYSKALEVGLQSPDLGSWGPGVGGSTAAAGGEPGSAAGSQASGWTVGQPGWRPPGGRPTTNICLGLSGQVGAPGDAPGCF